MSKMSKIYYKEITCADIVWFNLFEDIPYKWTRRFHLNGYDNRDREDDDDFCFEVVIKHLPCRRIGCATVEFTFDLDMDDSYSGNDLSHYQKYGILKNGMDLVFKTFTKKATYKKNSLFDKVLQKVLEYENDEEEEARIKRDDELEILSFKIAIDKIKRSKIYNFGLGLKLNMRDAGITS